MAGFTIDLAGRVRNFDLPKTQPLIPLYEAVVNSIYAIEERQEKEEFQGKIDIKIIREPQEIASIEGSIIVSMKLQDLVFQTMELAWMKII